MVTQIRARGHTAAAPKKAGRRKVTPPVAAVAEVSAGDDRLSDTAARHTLAVNPLIGMRVADFGHAARTLAGTAARQPIKAARHFGTYARELWRVAAGTSQIEADPKDKRFTDTAWQTSGVHTRLLKAYIAAGNELNRFIDDSALEPRDKERVRVVASIYMDTIAPSNTLLNPSAIKRMVDTGGESLLAGLRNLVHDIRHNQGLPSSVDKSAFEIGRNIATSPGSVVFRNAVLEVIQYQSTTTEVRKRPLIVCAPQVNKFYAIDLSPDKSVVKYVVGQGFQLFAISWRNPTKEQRHWDMSTYVEALDEAVDAVRQITGSDDVSMWGACSGGMTMACYLSTLASRGQRKVVNIVSPVCVLDPAAAMDSTMGLFCTPDSLKAIKATIKRKGVVDGAEMARVFAWLRPNDLIWNYWVNNYLHGKKPPAFDILFWNADTTRLPASFHADLLAIVEDSPFSKPGNMEVCGHVIDMQKVDVEAYIVAGITDHITSWKACYETARIYGKNSTFTLANAGHMQSILNAPGLAKSYFMHAPAHSAGPDAWVASAERQEGSWWPHWMEWMHPRSGDLVPAPKRLGSRKHPATVAAPGDYILEP